MLLLDFDIKKIKLTFTINNKITEYKGYVGLKA